VGAQMAQYAVKRRLFLGQLGHYVQLLHAAVEAILGRRWVLLGEEQLLRLLGAAVRRLEVFLAPLWQTVRLLQARRHREGLLHIHGALPLWLRPGVGKWLALVEVLLLAPTGRG